MNSELTWFDQDIIPSIQDWNNINKQLEENLFYVDLDSSSFSFQNNTQEYISCGTYQSQQTVASQIAQITNKQLPDNNYQKNICAYISKKIVHHLIDPKSEKLIRKFCRKAGCKYEQAKAYYTKRSKQIFGINHLSLMIIPQKDEQIKMKRMFCAFMVWFLRNKYMLYMLKYGKMEQKEKYIEFKNKYLLYVIEAKPQLEKYL